MQYLLFALLIFTQIALASWARPSIEQSPLVSASDILSWVQGSHPEVTTIEELLQKLPEAYRAYFVLQYDSHSNHSANATHPRVIFFGPDAKLLLAFSGLPSDSFYDTAEMIEYEPEAASYSFYSIHFQEKKAPAQIEINPQDCLRCHGFDPKPNWESYSLWPGTYGSLHDRILKGTQEHEGFTRFVETYPSSKRYQFLPTPFFVSANETYYLSNEGIGPSSSLSILLGFLNRDRIAKKMVASENHSRYRPAITAALVGCADPIQSFIPADLRSSHPASFETIVRETQELMEKDLARKKRALMKYLKVDEGFILGHADLHGFRDPEIQRISKLRYLLSKRRVNPIDFDRWALSISKTSLDFNDGVNGLENLIGHYLELAYEKENPVFSEIRIKETPFSIHPNNNSNPILTYSFEGSPNFVCELLMKEAKALSLAQ